MIPFEVNVAEAELDDLRDRLRRTRWPDPAPGQPWEYGLELGWLRELCEYWADGFDWRAREQAINTHPQFLVDVGDTTVHCVHVRSPHTGAVPLVLTHGWPSAFTEYLALVPLLTDPFAYDLPGPAFDLVLPSLPGYGFTRRPHRTGVNLRYVAGLWHQLMRQLGYDRYGVGGGDFGAGAATLLALDHPESVIGLHLTNIDVPPGIEPGTPPLTPAEQSYVDFNDDWWAREGGYKQVQATRPQTLGYALTDSPVGLAAWLLDKWRAWTDSGGDPVAHVGRDFLLELLTIYWVTRTITPSMFDYLDNRSYGVGLAASERVTVPTAVAGFHHQHVPEGEPPRSWAQRRYDIARWSTMPRGGHFAPVEEPRLVAEDILSFFATLA